MNASAQNLPKTLLDYANEMRFYASHSKKDFTGLKNQLDWAEI